MNGMILFLTGPTGSGKTDTSWALVSALDDIVFLDCDWFASRSPFSWNDPADVDSVYRAILSQMDFHRGDGRKSFVATLTLEMARMFSKRRMDFERFGFSIYAMRLFAQPDIIEKRIVERDRVQVKEEISNAIVQQKEFDSLFPDDAVFTCIDTSALDSEAIAAIIVQRIKV